MTLALACGALFLFYALIFPKPTSNGREVTQPLSTERGPNGYFALRRWLEAEPIRVVSFRERYDKLTLATDRQPTGNLLITTVPHRLTARPIELDRLRAWLARGNTILVMAGLADTPEWALDGKHGFSVLPQLTELSGIEFYPAHSVDDKKNDDKKILKNTRQQVVNAMQRLLQPQARDFSPTGNHPLMAGVNSVGAISEFPAGDWQARPKHVSAVVELAHLNNADAPAFWLASYGNGQVLVSAFASPFVNKLIGTHDNARLLSNIVAWSVGPNGSVLLDDAHQGAVAFYDPQAFFGDARLHRALGWMLLLWLVFVLGPSRIRPTVSAWNPIDIVSFVRATGGFMARILKPTEAGRRELSLFFNRIRHRIGLAGNGAPLWDWLESQGSIAAADLAQLRIYHDHVVGGDRIDFVRLHNLLGRIEGSFV